MEENGTWVTIRGRHVFIKKGQTLSQAITEYEMSKNADISKQQKYDTLKTNLTRSEKDALNDAYWKYQQDKDKLREELQTKKDKATTTYEEQKTKDNSSSFLDMYKEEADIDVDKMMEYIQLKEELTAERKEKASKYSGKLDEVASTVVYQQENGEIASMLTTKEYKTLSKDFANTLTDAEKDIICNYVASPAYAYSSELNALTKEKLSSSNNGGITRYALNLDKNNICTEQERNAHRLKALEDYNQRCEKLGVSRLDYEEERKWQKDNNIGSLSPYQLSDIRPYTKEQYAEARETAKKLQDIEDRKSQYSYGSEEYKKLDEEHQKIQEDVDPYIRKGDGKNWSAFYYQQIANEETNIVFKDEIGNGTLSETAKQGVVYMNAKQMLDLKLTDEQLAMQPTSISKCYKGIKSSTEEFDNIFKEKGVVLDKDILVFRRGRETQDEINEGFEKLGYVSTSAFDKLPKKMPSGLAFGSESYYLLVPKGSRVLFAEEVIGYKDKTEDDIKVSRGVKRQHEIILPRNTSFSNIHYDASRGVYVLLTEQHLFGEGGTDNE